MKTLLTRLCLAPLLGAALAGCDPERTRLEVDLQPDGAASIEVTHETPGTAADTGEDDLARAPREASRFMAAWSGVAAWTDVRATSIERGRTRVEATAWLPSLGDLRVRARPRFEVRREGATLEVRYLDPVRAGIAAIYLEDAGKVRAALGGPAAEVEATIEEVREALETMLAPWTFDLSLRLPGEVVDSVGFAREVDGRVVLHQDVLTLLAFADRHAADLREVRRQVATGELTPAEGYAALLRRAKLVAAEETPRVRCRLPDEVVPPAFDAVGR